MKKIRKQLFHKSNHKLLLMKICRTNAMIKTTRTFSWKKHYGNAIERVGIKGFPFVDSGKSSLQGMIRKSCN